MNNANNWRGQRIKNLSCFPLSKQRPNCHYWRASPANSGARTKTRKGFHSKVCAPKTPPDQNRNNTSHSLYNHPYVLNHSKIQGDGRKFLDRLKSYLSSKIFLQSLNEIRIYRLQPKFATKGEFFIFFCLWLSVRAGACCPLTFD